MAKYEKTERLEKVPMEYLWEGLVLSDNLYNYNGSVLLVPSGEVITKSKLDKLINFSDGNNYITTFRGSNILRVYHEGQRPSAGSAAENVRKQNRIHGAAKRDRPCTSDE